MTIERSVLQDFQRVVHSLEASISDFQSALNSWTESSDLQLMFLRHSKMEVDGLVVDAVMRAMLHRN